MAYIGRQPQIGNFQICDAISTVNNQAAYTMQVSSVNVEPETANHMIVSLNGVIQKPNSSYTVAGAVITFSSALVTGDVINFIQILGSVLDLGVPSDDTVTAAKLSSNAVITAKILDANVTTAKITDNAITLAKLASGTDGNIISYDTSGNPVAVATGNDGQVLTSAGAGAVPTFETLPAGGGKVLQVLQVTKTDTFSSTATSFGDITGLSLAITPSATSSKILINISVPFSCSTARAHFNLLRGSTDIIQGDASSSRIRTTYSGYADSTAGAAYYAMGIFSYSYLDSPSTVSETTYKIQTRVNSGTMYVNRSAVDNDNSESGRAASTITLTEIGA